MAVEAYLATDSQLGRPKGRELAVFLPILILLAWLAVLTWASVGGNISGTVTDQSGAVGPLQAT